MVLFFAACEKDTPITFPDTFNNGLFVVNEGQFNNANASLSFYDVKNDSIFNNVYEMVNNQPIGDILQSVNYDDNNIYLVVNNSGKIIVVDRKTLVQKGEITGLPSPRYMEYSGTADLWYVSNLFNDSLFVVNTSNYTIERKEYMNITPVEEMKTLNGNIYFSSLSTDRLMIKDISTNTLDSLAVGKLGGNSLAVDNESNLWLLCSGDYNYAGSGGLVKVNPNAIEPYQHTIEPYLNIENGYPTQLTYSSANNALYFINTDVYVLKLDNPTAQPEVFIEANGRSFYGLDVVNDQLFITDAIDYIRNGLVYEYDENGTLLKTFNAGINPNAVVVIP